jgi:hypothetical protein
MRAYLTTLLTVGTIGFAMLIGCAKGEEADIAPVMEAHPTGPGTEDNASIKLPAGPRKEDDEGFEAVGAGGASSGGSNSSTGGSDAGSNNSSGGSNSSSGSTGGFGASSGGSTSSGGTSGGSSGTTSSGGTSSGSSPPDPSSSGTPVSCKATTSCSTRGSQSVDLDRVQGDGGDMVKTAQGYKSTWLRVWVAEDSTDNIPIRARLTLTSPPGSNYDLFVHSDWCTLRGKSESTTDTDTIGASGRDATIFDDGYYVLVEVRHISGPCEPSAPWTLKVEGNK